MKRYHLGYNISINIRIYTWRGGGLPFDNSVGKARPRSYSVVNFWSFYILIKAEDWIPCALFYWAKKLIINPKWVSNPYHYLLMKPTNREREKMILILQNWDIVSIFNFYNIVYNNNKWENNDITIRDISLVRNYLNENHLQIWYKNHNIFDKRVLLKYSTNFESYNIDDNNTI